LVVAWCRMIPLSSSPLPSTAAATPPTTAPPSPRLVPPPLRPPPCCRRALSARSITHGAVMNRHAAWTPSRSNVSSAAPAPHPPCWGAGPLRQRRRHGRRNASVSPAVGGRPSFWSGDGNGSTATLMVVPGNLASR
jgi:hypothetical protein